MADTEKIPVIEGLFTLHPEEPKLIGSKCTSCGTYYFPQTISCSNPDCSEERVEDAFLSRRGKLWSFTVQHYPPPPPFKAQEPFVPFGIGVVEFPEEIRVAGILTESDPEKLKIGMELELLLDKAYEEDGKEVVTWKFRPV
ncbi:MAG: Zn-ribbon domain-containing OB-fold protein [Deltaproteobacteria bacterium]|nr:Zn-ribbon domain-containing OB-fold protein [Deltaproteobacteria bacterium]